jgi:Skp family chaperone for outer membrane proteins
MKKLLFALFVAFAAAGSVQAQTKIAHVNTQKLLDTLPSRKKAIEEIGMIEKQGM